MILERSVSIRILLDTIDLSPNLSSLGRENTHWLIEKQQQQQQNQDKAYLGKLLKRGLNDVTKGSFSLIALFFILALPWFSNGYKRAASTPVMIFSARKRSPTVEWRSWAWLSLVHFWSRVQPSANLCGRREEPWDSIGKKMENGRMNRNVVSPFLSMCMCGFIHLFFQKK